jgi:hypothetical protein
MHMIFCAVTFQSNVEEICHSLPHWDVIVGTNMAAVSAELFNEFMKCIDHKRLGLVINP